MVYFLIEHYFVQSLGNHRFYNTNLCIKIEIIEVHITDHILIHSITILQYKDKFIILATDFYWVRQALKKTQCKVCFVIKKAYLGWPINPVTKILYIIRSYLFITILYGKRLCTVGLKVIFLGIIHSLKYVKLGMQEGRSIPKTALK
jgi:hypothetical protein